MDVCTHRPDMHRAGFVYLPFGVNCGAFPNGKMEMNMFGDPAQYYYNPGYMQLKSRSSNLCMRSNQLEDQPLAMVRCDQIRSDQHWRLEDAPIPAPPTPTPFPSGLDCSGVADGSIDVCQNCLSDAQCSGDQNCCPYMKKCRSASEACCGDPRHDAIPHHATPCHTPHLNQPCRPLASGRYTVQSPHRRLQSELLRAVPRRSLFMHLRQSQLPQKLGAFPRALPFLLTPCLVLSLSCTGHCGNSSLCLTLSLSLSTHTLPPNKGTEIPSAR